MRIKVSHRVELQKSLDDCCAPGLTYRSDRAVNSYQGSLEDVKPQNSWLTINCFNPVFQGHQTALHRAAVVGNRDAISALIRGGCALDLQDKEGNTALHEVSWHGFSPCVKLLVKAGADVQVPNKAGNTALHLACQNGHRQTARMLLLGGAVADSKNNARDTCLHMAARYNHLAIIKSLLDSLCSAAEKNKVGETALHVAAGLNHKKAVRLLLEAGADAYTKNNAGHTALDKARDNNNKDVAILLAKSNQVQKIARRKTMKKRRAVLQTQSRTQSIPRDQVTLQTSDQRFPEVDGAHGGDYVQPEQNKPTLSLSTRKKIKKSRQKATVKDCYCKPLIKKLENKLKAKEMEMRSQIHTVEQEMNCRLEKIEHKDKHQIKALEKLTQEHVSAERTECHYRINQRATLKCMEGEKRQQVETRYYKLLRSPSADHSLVDTDPEGLPLLSFMSEESSSSLATYVNVLPSPGTSPGTRQYLHMKMNGSSDDYYNPKDLSIFKHKPLIRSLATADPPWQREETQEADASTSRPYKGIEPGDSSARSSMSTSTKQLNDSDTDTKPSPAWRHGKHLKNRIKAHRIHTKQGGAVSTLEVFSQGPAEATFIQERANLHAMEVTQHFFETVSTQLERWYERKIRDAQREVEQKAQQERVSLLQKIKMLEEELQRLHTNTET
ncbi:ankyrin repeat domain-containing protein 6 [Paramisgurnus dabryanus]|uniref:ankyrin repeat domain-containing protein 6 n=1 Tax=Paramisgurnus dabryanus TaxID=90735 RepID=UPI003CCF301B